MIASDYTWNHLAISSISDFLAMLLSINDGLQNSRFMVVLVGSQYGLANVIKIEKYVISMHELFIVFQNLMY